MFKWRGSHKDEEEQRKYERKWQETHPDYQAGRKDNYMEKGTLAMVVLTHYGGGKCACTLCGFDEIRALTLGMNSRFNRVTRKTGSLTKLFRVLWESNFPDNYITLCYNCYNMLISRIH